MGQIVGLSHPLSGVHNYVLLCFCPGVLRQLSQTSSYRNHYCSQTRDTCSFYDHCIEPQFPCGGDGFVLSYAQNRCKAIRRLKTRRIECKHCVSTEGQKWAGYSEECFQDKLLDLLERYNNRRPDPQTCLEWEREAIKELNSCYTVDGRVDHVPDIAKLINNFQVGDSYYDSMVSNDLSEIAENNTSIQNLTAGENTTVHRLILCIKANKYPINEEIASPNMTNQDYVKAVQSKLTGNANILHYAGPEEQYPDTEEQGVCSKYQPSDINSKDELIFHLVTWFTSHPFYFNHTMIDFQYGNATIIGQMFELTSKSTINQHTSCGNGLREVREDCDYTENYGSCTLECRVREYHDCSTDRLSPSFCWPEACGDGCRTRGEECDDGNNNDMDGCSSSCQIEQMTHICTYTTYNRTSECSQHPPVPRPVVVPAKLTSSQSATVAQQSKRTVESSGSKPLPFSLLAFVGLSMLSLLR